MQYVRVLLSQIADVGACRNGFKYYYFHNKTYNSAPNLYAGSSSLFQELKSRSIALF